MLMHSIARSVFALGFLAPFASANIYIVDASGGGAFTDIQAAILATQPGDVLLVQPGNYAPFALDRGLTIIGYGACNVSGGITIAGIPAGQTAAVVDVECPTWSIQGCSGHVIVQDVQQLATCSVTSSPDVRFARVIAPYGVYTTAPQTALTVQGSRLELADSGIVGQGGAECGVPAYDGAKAIDCTSSRLHTARSSVMGGSGGNCDQPQTYCGDGNIGLDLHSGAEAIVCGTPNEWFVGGYQGYVPIGTSCYWDGDSEFAITLNPGSTLRRSGVTVADFQMLIGTSCWPLTAPGVHNLGGTETLPPLVDPTLIVAGTPTPGASVQFTLVGPVGASVVLSFGRNAVVQTDPNTLIEVLTPASRNVNLGTIPASGSVSFTWPIASVLLPGTRLLAQGRVTLPSGEVRRTNSVPVILR